MDIKRLFLENFGKVGYDMTDNTKTIGNVPDIDFELYSTLADAEAEDDGTWWDQMTEDDKERYNKPKNPKRWKIYGQGTMIPDENNSPTTSFGDIAEVGFPSALGPTIGNNNITGGNTPRIANLFSQVGAVIPEYNKNDIPKGSNGAILEGVDGGSFTVKGDDIQRDESTNEAKEEASLSRENDHDSARSTTYEGDSVPIQAVEWKIYVLSKQAGCVLDYDSDKSNGAILTDTRFINSSNVPEHLKCTDKAPVCDGYMPWSGKYNYDLSTIHAAGPGQTWGQCRGLSTGEVTALKEKAILESTAQRISDMHSLKVKPKQSIRQEGKMSTIWNESEYARAQRLSGGLRLLQVLNATGDQILTDDTNPSRTGGGYSFLYDQDSFDSLFPTPFNPTLGSGFSDYGRVLIVQHKTPTNTPADSDTINYDFVASETTQLKVVFYRRPPEAALEDGSGWKSFPVHYGFGKLIGVESGTNWVAPSVDGNATNTPVDTVMQTGMGRNNKSYEMEYIEIQDGSLPDLNSLTSNKPEWKVGDILVPILTKDLATLKTQHEESQNKFAEAAFTNLANRYDQRLSQLQDQDKVLQMQLHEIKKKRDKIGAKKYKINREENELIRSERQIILDQNLDNDGKQIYNILSLVTGLSSIVILGFIIKGM